MTELLSRRPLYKGFFDLLMVRMRAAGGEEMEHHVLVVGEAVAVLPYDPVRRVALLVSMPRGAVAMAGLPDLLEPVAGRRESDDPESCARREAMEEAGVRLGALEHVGTIWPAAANSYELLDYYLAPYAPEDRIAAGGGLAEEQEHIAVHELPLADLWARFEANDLGDGKLVTLLMALRLRHPALFAAE